MAKAKKAEQEEALEKKLWRTADKLPKNMDAAEYKHVVLGEKNHFWRSAPSKTLLFLVIADMILGLLFSTFGLLGFKAIPFTQTTVVIIYTAVSSFILNDLIKIVLFKKWHEKVSETVKIISTNNKQ